MITYVRAFALLIVVAAGMAGLSGTAGAADEKPSATLTISHDSSGIGIGWHSGEGILTVLDGSEYAVTMDAYSIAGLGFSNVVSIGKVFNLAEPLDLTGEYTGTGDSSSFRRGEGKATLRNDANSVRIEMVSRQTGVRAGIGIGSISFKLGKRLKGPAAPPPVAAAPAPPPPVKQAPLPAAVVTKPTQYILTFGFNKSRVNLATSQVLDSILADWKEKGTTYHVVGHADVVGSDKFNMRLSRNRADAVKRALIGKGVPSERIVAVGMGKRQLAEKTGPGHRLRANRRVVLTVVAAK